MNILLIHPPDNRESIAPGRFEPLALEVLAATVPEHNISILDLRLDGRKELDLELIRHNPDIIGVTANNTIHVNAALHILDYIRTKNRRAKLIVGGHHVTMLPADFRRPTVDAIFYGWAEKSFPAYVETLTNGKDFSRIHGIEILENGHSVYQCPNDWDITPADIPYPRRDLVARYQKKYRSDTGHRTSLVNTSRGCPNRCSFCSIWKANSGRFFMRDVEHVCNEIVNLPKEIEYVFFADDNTFINPTRALKLALMLEESGVGKRYSGYCRSDTIARHPEVMEAWKRIGLNNLCVGFEVTNDDELKEVNKKNLTVNNEKAAQILNALDIPFRPHFLISPDFNREQFQEILRYVRRHRLISPIFPILTPIPGSDNYNEVKDSIILGYEYFDYAHSVLPTRLPFREFYRSWVSLFLSSYPVAKNFRNFLIRRYASLTSNKELYHRTLHLDLLNLIRLRLFAFYVIIKLAMHCRKQERKLTREQKKEIFKDPVYKI